jgi:hypothetical protein
LNWKTTGLNTMSSATDVPPPKPTLQVSTAVTATDHGQIVVLVAWLCFTAGLLLSLVRVYIRWPLNALAGKDDGAYAVSAILAIIQTAITINAVSNGFGRTESELSDTQVVDAAKVSCSSSSLQDEQFFHRMDQSALYPRQSLIFFLRPSTQQTSSSFSPRGSESSPSPSSSLASPKNRTKRV